MPVVRLVGNGVERDLRRLLGPSLLRFDLVDVGADVEARELDERHDRAAGAAAGGDEPKGETASPTNARLAVTTPANGARISV